MTTNNPFLTRLHSGKPIVLDGATGTNLQARGLERGKPGEQWVMEQPDQIIQLHKDFIAAGSDLILTCTFGGTTIRLAHIDMADRVLELNQRAVALARQAAEGTSTLVAGSIGPTGQLLKPLGPLDSADAEAAFAQQARALAEAGVDVLVIETQFDFSEAEAAIKAVKSVTDLPLVCSFSYDRGTRTMMGVRPTQVGERLSNLGLAALGINCGRSLEENNKSLVELRAATSLPIWFKPNAGLPQTDVQGNTIYDTTPSMMGGQVAGWLQSGAQLVGGCCGTSPAHLQAIAVEAHKDTSL